MLRRIIIVVGIFIAVVGTWAAETPLTAQAKLYASASQTSRKPAIAKAHVLHKNDKNKKVENVEPPPPPPPPPTLEQQPAVAPEVSYRAGMLTIVARNSTMSDILNAVRRVTGATVDRPAGTGNERVVGTFGPGIPRNVLAQLLNGSRYDYIILGSATRPGGIDRIMLSLRSNVAPTSAVATNNPAGSVPPNNNAPSAAADDEEVSPESDLETETPPETDQQALPQQAEPQGVPVQPLQGVPPQASPYQQNPNQPPNQPQVKTPEELLRELQQMQQQQQQQQQQQAPPPPQ
jgi:hypothetical protein